MGLQPSQWRREMQNHFVAASGTDTRKWCLTGPSHMKYLLPRDTPRHRLIGGLAGARLALALAAISLGCASGHAPEPTDPPVATLAAPAPEALAVDAARFSTQNLDWFDSQRQRPVPAKLYLPANRAEAGALPLVVFSHGIGGSRDGYSYLGQYFAAHGYGSLHVQHVGSDRQLWLGNPFALTTRLSDAAQGSEALDRVLDLRFALDQMLKAELGAVFDRQRITAAGHSYGANTTMLITGAQLEAQGKAVSLRDPRISAAILISAPPFYGLGTPDPIVSNIQVPTLHITATEDVIRIPGYESGVEDRLNIFRAMGNGGQAPKVLAVFKGGSHSIFTDRAATGGRPLNPRVKIATRQLALAFLNAVPAGNYQALDDWSLGNAELVAQFEKRVP